MKQRQAFFHIGLHKTASTWLQRAFFPKLCALEYLRTQNLPFIDRKVREQSTQPLLISHEEFSGPLSATKRPGDRTEWLGKSMAAISSISPTGSIVIGFRNQKGWLNSAYAERAKKAAVKPDAFFETFSIEELRWCKVLSQIESYQLPVFGFLYEELLSCPEALVHDLCNFFGTPVPANWRSGLRHRSNPSPRSAWGRRLSRPFFFASDRVKRLAIKMGAPHPKPFRSQLHRAGSNLGTWVDRFAAPAPSIQLNVELTELLSVDWERLVEKVGEKRGRDLRFCINTGTRRHSAPPRS